MSKYEERDIEGMDQRGNYYLRHVSAGSFLSVVKIRCLQEPVEMNPGESYTTSLERADGTVKVYSRYWVPVPMDYFELLKPDIAPKIDTTIATQPEESAEEK